MRIQWDTCHVWNFSRVGKDNICFFLPLNTLSSVRISFLFPFSVTGSRQVKAWAKGTETHSLLQFYCGARMDAAPSPGIARPCSEGGSVGFLLSCLPCRGEWLGRVFLAGIPSGSVLLLTLHPYTTPPNSPAPSLRTTAIMNCMCCKSRAPRLRATALPCLRNQRGWIPTQEPPFTTYVIVLFCFSLRNILWSPQIQLSHLKKWRSYFPCCCLAVKIKYTQSTWHRAWLILSPQRTINSAPYPSPWPNM